MLTALSNRARTQRREEGATAKGRHAHDRRTLRRMPDHNATRETPNDARERGREDDPLTMYYVVRKDVPLSLAQAMSLAGAGAVLCADMYRQSARWRERFADWHARSYRKVALRADAAQCERVLQEMEAAALETDVGLTLLCLPPRRKSEREELLVELVPFTDARRPRTAPESPRPPLVYVVRPAVMRSMGKAMAQAGHGALMCADQLGDRYAAEFAQWRTTGRGGEVRVADDTQWEELKAEGDCVAVRDAGFTQVAPGTETVLALPPRDEQPDRVRALPFVA